MKDLIAIIPLVLAVCAVIRLSWTLDRPSRRVRLGSFGVNRIIDGGAE